MKQLPSSGVSAWLVTRYDDVLTVLKDDRFGKDKINARTPPWLPGMFKPLLRNMLDVDVPDHTRLRGLVQNSSHGAGAG